MNWFALTLTSLLVAWPLGSPGWAPAASRRQAPAPARRVVHIVAERFVFTPSEIRVEAGTVLEIRLTSEDTDHGFHILTPDGVNLTIPKRNRGEAVAVFEATEPGDYAFECSHVCGAGHELMRGRIRVTPRKSSGAAQ